MREARWSPKAAKQSESNAAEAGGAAPGHTGWAQFCALGSTCGGAAGGIRIAAANAAPAAADRANVRGE